jgi:hypothetical protein
MFLSKQEYYDKIGDPKQEKEKLKSALASAMDIRKFEIDLYWKRSQYFWIFTSIVFGVYGYTWNLAKNEPKYAWIPFVVSATLLLVTVNWYMVIRGSKFWQDNWERHVDLLEDVVHGPLYKTVIISKPKSDCIFDFKPYPYSVSKLNQAMCLFFYYVSVGLFFRELALLAFHKFNWDTNKLDQFSIGACLVIVLGFILILKYKCYSGLGINYDNEMGKMENETFKIYERQNRFS